MTSEDPFDMTRRVPEDGKGAPDEPIDRTVPAQPAPGSGSGSGKDQAAGGQEASSPEPVSPEDSMPEAADDSETSSPPPKPADPLLGVELGGCQVDSLLGRGAMGAVYRATQIRLNRQVAVKVMRPELLSDSRMLERFESEARMVAQFQSPHVVMVHDVGFEHGVHFLVMELVRGKNLRDYTRLLAGGRLPVAEAIPLLRQACKGLEEAQRQGIIHRDIKPDNLMLTDRGELKIADFGIAKPENDDLGLTMTQELIGTPLYMSPEQCQGSRDIDFRSDMYSLGATFYYLLTGEPPVRASSVYELIQTKTRLENLCLWKALPELDEHHPLSRVVARMTALSRDDRYDDYDDLATDLMLVQQGRTMEIKAPLKKRTAGNKSKGARPGGKAGAGKSARRGADAGGRGGRSAATPEPEGGGRGLAIAVTVLLLAGGGAGGWWWYTQRSSSDVTPDGPGGGTKVNEASTTANGDGVGGSGEGPAADLPSIAAALTEHRAALAKSGPTSELRELVAALQPPEAEVAGREALLAAIDQGLPIRAALDKLEFPAAFELPFDDLAAHLNKVDDDSRLPEDPLAELATWVSQAQADARNVPNCATLAASTLSTAFADWHRQRRGGADTTAAMPPAAELSDEVRAELREQLDAIGRGRARVLELLPSQRAVAEAAISDADFNVAQQSLEIAPPPPIDFAKTLADYQDTLEAKGPLPRIRDEATSLQPTVRADVEARRRLLDDWQAAWDLLDSTKPLVNLFPSNPAVPFETDVEAYFEKIDLVLNPDGRKFEDLPEWVREKRRSLRLVERLQPKVVEACRVGWAGWQAKRSAGAVASRALETELETLREGLSRARRLFPEAAAELDTIATKEQIDAKTTELVQAQKLGSVVAAVRTTRSRLEAIATLAAWRESAAGLTRELADHASRVVELGKDPVAERELQGARALAASWRAADDRVRRLSTALASGDLGLAVQESRSRLSGTVGREAFELLSSATTSCREAFTGLLSNLDCTLARERLTAVGHDLTAGGERAAADRVVRWVGAIDGLESATKRMARVQAGSTPAHGAADGFFLAATETTVADFVQFQAAARALVGAGGSLAERRQALVEKLGVATPPAAELGRVLRARPPGRATLPVEAVSGWQAWACAAWFGGSLPTKAEWALAAFGDGGAHSYPWGGRDDRPLNRSLVDATGGSKAWRKDGVAIYNLAGNVAEWLLPAQGAATGELAGGSYRDVRIDQRRRAGGEDFQKAAMDRALPGMGFRMIVRPRDVLAPEFAGGKFPALR